MLLVQNWTPVLSLVFLGGQTQALPLSIWILFSVAAGAITSIFITSCFQISSFFSQPRAKKQRRRATETSTRFAREANNPNKMPDPPKTSTYSYTAASSPRPPQTSAPESDGWDTESNDDWDFTEDAEPTTQETDRQNYRDRAAADSKSSSNLDDNWEYVPQDTERQPQDRQRSYSSEANRSPSNESDESESGDRSASVYSYSAGEPKNSGVGRVESVYDAEYRVLTPPYKKPNQSTPATGSRPQNQNSNDDDWTFVDDEDWKVEDKDDSSRPEK